MHNFKWISVTLLLTTSFAQIKKTCCCCLRLSPRIQVATIPTITIDGTKPVNVRKVK